MSDAVSASLLDDPQLPVAATACCGLCCMLLLPVKGWPGQSHSGRQHCIPCILVGTVPRNDITTHSAKPAATVPPTSELRPADMPLPGVPEPARAAPAGGAHDQSVGMPAVSAVPSPVPSPVPTSGHSVQGTPAPGCQMHGNAPVPRHAMHLKESAQRTPSLPQQQQRGTPSLPWCGHGQPMLIVKEQWVQPQWPAPPGQLRPKFPASRWQQLHDGVRAAHPEWGDSPLARLQGEVAVRQMLVEAAKEAFGQPVSSHLQHPQADVQQPALQTSVQSVQGQNRRWYHCVPLKPEPQPWCIFCKEGGHSTQGCLPFACPTLVGDDGWDPDTGEMVSGTRLPGHLQTQDPAVHTVCTTSLCSAA